VIGLLFHGPEVFDSGWARRIIEAMKMVDHVRCVLAGTMGRTAVMDNNIDGVEFWGKMPGACLKELALEAHTVIIVNFGKSEHAGLVFGAMVTKQAEVTCPVVQIECSGPFFVEWIDECDRRVIDTFRQMGIPQKDPIKIESCVWEVEGSVYRRMTSTEPGDFVFVNGIMVGRATANEVVLACQDGHIVEIRGADVKAHGIEKLDRFGGVDLRSVKLASTSTIRRTGHAPRIRETKGHGVAFVDHSGMYIYDIACGMEGVVAVGDDTTAVVADILFRYQIPVIGIVDGDADIILQDVHFTPGSLKLTVAEDDVFGLKVFDTIFKKKHEIDAGFEDIRDRIVDLAGEGLLERQDF